MTFCANTEKAQSVDDRRRSTGPGTQLLKTGRAMGARKGARAHHSSAQATDDIISTIKVDF